MKLSIVVPVYNGDKYIVSCYDSIKKYLYFVEKEILFINNGSNDNSMQLLNSINDKEVSVINTDIKGVSHARNIGIEHSSGDWIFFMDVDDEIYSSDLGLLDVMNGNSDLIWICYKTHSENVTDSYSCNYEDNIFSISEFSKKWHGEGMVWPFIFRRSLIKEGFYEEMKYFEDADFLYRYLISVTSVSFTHFLQYSYYIRNSSAMQSSTVETKYKDAIVGAIRNLKLMSLLDENHANALMPHMVKDYLWVIRSAPDADYKEFCRQFRLINNKQRLMRVKFKQKILVLLTLIYMDFFRFIFRYKV